jgi:hypothetical protein
MGTQCLGCREAGVEHTSGGGGDKPQVKRLASFADVPQGRGRACCLCEVMYMGTQCLGCREVGVKRMISGERQAASQKAC